MMLVKLKRLDDGDFIFEEIQKNDKMYDAFQAEVPQYVSENKTELKGFIQNLKITYIPILLLLVIAISCKKKSDEMPIGEPELEVSFIQNPAGVNPGI